VWVPAEAAVIVLWRFIFERLALPVTFDLVLIQDVTDGSPVPERGHGVVEFAPEADTLVKRYVNSHLPLTLVGGGIRVVISLNSAHDFKVVGSATASL